MSYYQKTITAPANTTSGAPVSETLDLQAGVIHRIRVSIPAGHAWLTGVRILQGLHQIAPTTGGEWFQGDDDNFDYNEFIEVLTEGAQLTVEAYNSDTDYAHNFAVGVGVMPRWVLLPQEIIGEALQVVSSALAAMAKWFGMTR